MSKAMRIKAILEPVNTGDADILDATVFELGQDREPEFGAFVFLEPEAKYLFPTVRLDTQASVDRLFDNLACIAYVYAQCIEVDDWINLFKLPVLPGPNIV